MKNFLLIVAALGLFLLPMGCGGKFFSFDSVGDVRTTAVLAGIAAYEIGYTVAGLEDAEIDRGIRNVYKLAKTGELDQDGLNQVTDLIAKKIPDRPTLPRSIMALLQLVGVRFDPDGNAIGLDQIPPEVFAAVEREYLAGVDLYARQLSGELSETDVDEILSWMRDNYARFERGRHGSNI